MNSQDWHEGMVRNQEWEVKRQAKLDALYERERAKYSSPAPVSTPVCSQSPVVSAPTTSRPNYFKGSLNPAPTTDINVRLDKLEARIDKLYELVAAKPNYTSDGMFVIAPNNATVFANQSFTLTDEQFKVLMSKLIDD